MRVVNAVDPERVAELAAVDKRTVAEVAGLTGLSPRQVAEILSAAGIEPVTEEDRLRRRAAWLFADQAGIAEIARTLRVRRKKVRTLLCQAGVPEEILSIRDPVLAASLTRLSVPSLVTATGLPARDIRRVLAYEYGRAWPLLPRPGWLRPPPWEERPAGLTPYQRDRIVAVAVHSSDVNVVVKVARTSELPWAAVQDALTAAFGPAWRWLLAERLRCWRLHDEHVPVAGIARRLGIPPSRVRTHLRAMLTALPAADARPGPANGKGRLR